MILKTFCQKKNAEKCPDKRETTEPNVKTTDPEIGQELQHQNISEINQKPAK